MGINESEAIVEEQFSVGDSPALSLDTVSGRVTIRPAGEQIIRVHARLHGRSHAVENTRIECSDEDGVVKVHARGSSRRFMGGDGPCQVDFDVLVPRGCRIRVETVSAGVDLREIAGAVDVHTVSGRVSVDEASESSSITTVSGGFFGHSLDGSLQLMAVSGSSEVTGSRLSDFDVESVSGNIALETPLAPTGRYRMKTVSGGMHLHVPDGTAITVHLESVSGRIHSGPPSAIEKVGFGDWQGTINGGGAELRLHSVSGNVTITHTNAVVPA